MICIFNPLAPIEPLMLSFAGFHGLRLFLPRTVQGQSSFVFIDSNEEMYVTKVLSLHLITSFLRVPPSCPQASSFDERPGLKHAWGCVLLVQVLRGRSFFPSTATENSPGSDSI